MFNSGSNTEATRSRASRVIHDPVDAAPPWTLMANMATERYYGMSFHQPRPAGAEQLVMNVGGNPSGAASTSLATTQVCFPGRGQAGAWNDPVLPGWDWSSGPPINLARFNANTVLLPSAEVLLVGGSKSVYDPVSGSATLTTVLTSEILRGETWRLADQQSSSRGYHSTAVLLPSGRILSGGADFRSADYEIFSPWYMSGPRPVITAAPSVMNYSNPDCDDRGLHQRTFDDG